MHAFQWVDVHVEVQDVSGNVVEGGAQQNYRMLKPEKTGLARLIQLATTTDILDCDTFVCLLYPHAGTDVNFDFKYDLQYAPHLYALQKPGSQMVLFLTALLASLLSLLRAIRPVRPSTNALTPIILPRPIFSPTASMKWIVTRKRSISGLFEVGRGWWVGHSLICGLS